MVLCYHGKFKPLHHMMLPVAACAGICSSSRRWHNSVLYCGSTSSAMTCMYSNVLRNYDKSLTPLQIHHLNFYKHNICSNKSTTLFFLVNIFCLLSLHDDYTSRLHFYPGKFCTASTGTALRSSYTVFKAIACIVEINQLIVAIAH